MVPENFRQFYYTVVRSLGSYLSTNIPCSHGGKGSLNGTDPVGVTVLGYTARWTHMADGTLGHGSKGSSWSDTLGHGSKGKFP